MSLNQTLLSQAVKIVSPEQKLLLTDANVILETTEGDQINDYSFMVAPVAKAYEGYLKDFFLKIGLIDQKTHQGDRFRVGKTLNPSLRYKNFSIFQRLTELDDSGQELAETLWDAWKYGRNLIFHYFPNQVDFLDKTEATNRIDQVLSAIIKSDQFVKNNIITQKFS